LKDRTTLATLNEIPEMSRHVDMPLLLSECGTLQHGHCAELAALFSICLKTRELWSTTTQVELCIAVYYEKPGFEISLVSYNAA
jgi:hypothetical protein